MDIRLTCPHCLTSVKAPSELAGKRASCPGCRGTFLVPKMRSVLTHRVLRRKAAPKQPVEPALAQPSLAARSAAPTATQPATSQPVTHEPVTVVSFDHDAPARNWMPWGALVVMLLLALSVWKLTADREVAGLPPASEPPTGTPHKPEEQPVEPRVPAAPQRDIKPDKAVEPEKAERADKLAEKPSVEEPTVPADRELPSALDQLHLPIIPHTAPRAHAITDPEKQRLREENERRVKELYEATLPVNSTSPGNSVPPNVLPYPGSRSLVDAEVDPAVPPSPDEEVRSARAFGDVRRWVVSGQEQPLLGKVLFIRGGVVGIQDLQGRTHRVAIHELSAVDQLFVDAGRLHRDDLPLGEPNLEAPPETAPLVAAPELAVGPPEVRQNYLAGPRWWLLADVPGQIHGAFRGLRQGLVRIRMSDGADVFLPLLGVSTTDRDYIRGLIGNAAYEYSSREIPPAATLVVEEAPFPVIPQP